MSGRTARPPGKRHQLGTGERSVSLASEKLNDKTAIVCAPLTQFTFKD